MCLLLSTTMLCAQDIERRGRGTRDRPSVDVSPSMPQTPDIEADIRAGEAIYKKMEEIHNTQGPKAANQFMADLKKQEDAKLKGIQMLEYMRSVSTSEAERGEIGEAIKKGREMLKSEESQKSRVLQKLRGGGADGQSTPPSAEARSFITGAGSKMLRVPSEDAYLGETEVTQAQWITIMGKKTNVMETYINPSEILGENRPIVGVDRGDALDFCRRLTRLDQESGMLPEGYKYDLPTGSLWEYACRANSTEKLSDAEIDAIAWTSKNSGGESHSVASKSANAWGFYDMLGNVEEWVSQLHPDRENGAGFSATRGGCWYAGQGTSSYWQPDACGWRYPMTKTI